MPDMLEVAQRIKTIADDPSIPIRQRLLMAFKAMSECEIPGMTKKTSEKREQFGAMVQYLIARYASDPSVADEATSDVEVQKDLDSLNEIMSEIITDELDWIIFNLDEAFHTLPIEAIEAARKNRDLVIPRLIEVLKDTIAAARDGELPDGDAHFFAVFLLTEFQAEEAFPTILEAFLLPDDLPFDLFGDVMIEVLARIFALFAADNTELIDSLIRNPELSESIRWTIASTYIYFVRDGRLERAEAVSRLQQHLRHAIDNKNEELIGGLVVVLCSFAPREAFEDIKKAFDQDLIDTSMMGLEDVEQVISEGEEGVRENLRRCPDTGIPDTIEELKDWYAFKEKPRPQRAETRHEPIELPPDTFELPPDTFELPTDTIEQPPDTSEQPPDTSEQPPVASALTRGSRVGRNAPCPCGSGKKYKKCCKVRASR